MNLSPYGNRVKRISGVYGNTLRHLARLKFDEKRIGHISDGHMAKTKKMWAEESLKIYGVKTHILGADPAPHSTLFVGNHISYLDIILLMSSADVVFVAKKELERWPILGSAAKKAGTVFVKRDSGKSRQQVALEIPRQIREERKNIAIFPSGTTLIDETKPWRRGPFKIAERSDVNIQPFRIWYNPIRPAAYLLEDSLLPHMWKMSGEQSIEAWIEFHPPIKVNPGTSSLAAEKWQAWTWAPQFRTQQSSTKQ